MIKITTMTDKVTYNSGEHTFEVLAEEIARSITSSEQAEELIVAVLQEMKDRGFGDESN